MIQEQSDHNNTGKAKFYVFTDEQECINFLMV